MGSWKAFMWPLVVAQTNRMYTVPVAIGAFQGEYNTQYELLMACSVMALIPIVVVFFFAQRYFISGIRMGAIKG